MVIGSSHRVLSLAESVKALSFIEYIGSGFRRRILTSTQIEVGISNGVMPNFKKKKCFQNYMNDDPGLLKAN